LRVLDEGDGHPPRGGLRLTQMAAAPPAPVSSGPPDAPDFAFSVHAAAGAARSGVFTTPHGAVPTPAFMAVGTLATVKTLDPAEDVVRSLGGLHRFMQWDGPILTDSGGFQVFSLETMRRVSEEGVEFRSHVDGSRRFFTPERVMDIQRDLGADVVMQLDHVIPGQAELADARDASERSVRWLARCKTTWDAQRAAQNGASAQALFPIVQGGIHPSLRREAASAIRDMANWPGYAIGGLSVGESKDDMHAILDIANDALPQDRPRYLMGVGFPDDLVEGVRRGVDLFDCVAPTRMGRTG